MTSREDMISYITFERTPPAVPQPIDQYRYALIGFISDYWERLQAQLKCPAKNLRSLDPAKQNPRPCFGCVDQQVVACVVDNAAHEHVVRKYLPVWKE